MDDLKHPPNSRAYSRWWLHWWLGCALLVTSSARAQDAAHQIHHFDLPGGDARKQLNQFALQADVQTLFDYNDVAGLVCHAVSGNLAPMDAMRAMLKGVPLNWTMVNDHTIAITRVKAKQPPSSWWQRVFARNTTSREIAPSQMSQVLIAGHEDLNQPQPIDGELIRLDRTDIEATGLVTTQDLLHTLPQVFGGGPNEDTQFGREALSNSAKGVGVNLRGLDAGATLVLWDGRRLAPSGTSGVFTDVSNLPLSAIDHIDLLPEGAGLQYGADGIGGVVNFVTRSDFAGAETQALVGAVTSGSLHEQQFSQLWGTHWQDGHLVAGFEFYRRTALPARDRRQETGDLRPLGGSNFELPYGNPGTIVQDGRTWALPAVPGGALVPGTMNLYDQDANADILPRQQRWSLYASGRQTITENFKLFADVLYSARQMSDIYPATTPLELSVPNTNPFYENPAGGNGPVNIVTGPQAFFGPGLSEDELHAGSATLGFDLAGGGDWVATGYLRYALEQQHQTGGGLWDPAALASALADPDPATAFNPFGGPNNPTTLAAIARSSLFRLDSDLFVADLSTSGTLWHLPSGAVRWTVGGEYRDQTLRTLSLTPLGSMANPNARLGRTVRSAFSELLIPLVGAGTAHPGIRSLELTVAGRHDDYSDVGGAAVPQVGLRWVPFDAIALRGTWSKAFRPPGLPDLVRQNAFSELSVLPDASSPTGQTVVLDAFGANAGLQPERSRRWTLGAELAPGIIDRLALAVDYFNILSTGRIDQVELAPDVLDRPDLAWLVTREVTTSERTALCNSTNFLGPAGSCLASPIGAILDDRLQNIESLKTSGLDVIARYALPMRRATVTLGLNGTYLFEYSEVPTPTAGPETLLNTPNYPINLRIRGSAAWDFQSLGATMFVNFTNGYRDPTSVPARSIRSWTTFDLQLRWGIERNGSLLSDTKIALNVHNLLNQSAPFFDNPIGIGFDQANADLLGRLVSLQLIKSW